MPTDSGGGEAIASGADAPDIPKPSHNYNLMLRQFNWRFISMRVLVSALTLMITAIVTPDIYFVQWTILNVLFLAIALGLVNAILRLIVQFLTLPLIFATYGLVVVLIDAGVLFVLAAVFPERFVVNGLSAALVGGLLMGIISTVLESLFGLTMPIVPPEQAAIRERIREQPWRLPEASAARSTDPEVDADVGADPDVNADSSTDPEPDTHNHEEAE